MPTRDCSTFLSSWCFDFSSYVIIGGLNLNSGLEASTIVVTSTAEEKLLISSIVSLQEEKPSSLFPLLFYIARSCNDCRQFISTMTLLTFYRKNNSFILKNVYRNGSTLPPGSILSLALSLNSFC